VTEAALATPAAALTTRDVMLFGAVFTVSRRCRNETSGMYQHNASIRGVISYYLEASVRSTSRLQSLRLAFLESWCIVYTFKHPFTSSTFIHSESLTTVMTAIPFTHILAMHTNHFMIICMSSFLIACNALNPTLTPLLT